LAVALGNYPTPVERLEALSRPGCDLWVKRDDLTSALYGGNKVRKLERLLADARDRGAERIVTVGAVGSHHVLATAVYGRRAGFAVEAVLVPQPRTDHVVEDLRADLAQGMKAIPARSYAHAAARVAARLGRGSYFIPVGGSNLLGALGYVDAARELAAQVQAGAMPEPDLVVVTLGSGGTAGGLAAGFALCGMKTRVLAVTVAEPPAIVGRAALRLARACVAAESAARHQGNPGADATSRIARDVSYLGKGYGYPTPWGERAGEAAARAGLTLDPTYTAKTFAAALDVVARRGAHTVLYWHTFSSAPMAPLLDGAPEEEGIDARLRTLFR
jgi:1-aminocyclopropane-1-carboxylate deaminase/D-cysteine desulfhydrase-like pyridoxal-dependent ACC family enzyme